MAISQFNSKTEELVEKRKDIYDKMTAMQAVDSSKWSEEDQATWNTMDQDFEANEKDIEAEKQYCERRSRMERIEEQANRQVAADRGPAGEMRATREGRLPGLDNGQMRSLAFSAWMLPAKASDQMKFAARSTGLSWTDTEIDVRAYEPSAIENHRPLYAGPNFGGRVRQVVEERQQGTTPDAAGGYLVPQGIMQAIDIALLQFAAPRQYSDVIRAGDGREILWPVTDDTSVKGEIIVENAAANQGDVVFAQTSTKPYLYSSKYVPVSIQLMQDSATAMQPLLGRLLGERLGRIQADHFTTGTGTGQPTGITVDAPTSGVIPSGIDAVSTDDLYDLKHSVDPAYRGGAAFMFADSILAAIKKLKDGDLRPIWQAGLSSSEPNTIDGDPYVINQSMPVGANAKMILYGMLSKYKIHDALSLQFRRLTEIHALNHQITFMAFQRSDGKLLDAGTNPVKSIVNPAT